MNPSKNYTPNGEPLVIDDVMAGLHNALDQISEDVPQKLLLEVEKMATKALKSSDDVEKLWKFSRLKRDEKKLHIVTSEVPHGILPASCSAFLHDIKVHARGPDDYIYDNNPDIREKIPRGITFMEFIEDGRSKYDLVIYGHKKFTGGVGDEDENQPESNNKWKDYCLRDPNTATTIVCMEKLNGELAHFSIRYIYGQCYTIVGSKNVHMIIRGKDDIDLYEGSRYEYAKIIAKTVCDHFNDMDSEKHRLTLSFIHHTKCTVVSEILQKENQHIVNLSLLNKPKLVVVSCTPTYMDEKISSLLTLAPHHTLDMFKSLGFHTANYRTLPYIEMMDHKEEVRKMENSEGEVFYLLDENENTIGLIKVKTVWYIILRALREKAVHCFTAARKKPEWKLQDRIASTHKRFEEIQQWLKISDEDLQAWKNAASYFLNWLNEEIRNDFSAKEIRPKFPVLWAKFKKCGNVE